MGFYYSVTCSLLYRMCLSYVWFDVRVPIIIIFFLFFRCNTFSLYIFAQIWHIYASLKPSLFALCLWDILFNELHFALAFSVMHFMSFDFDCRYNSIFSSKDESQFATNRVVSSRYRSCQQLLHDKNTFIFSINRECTRFCCSFVA